MLEYQSKALLQESGVAIQEFCVLDGTNGPNTKHLQSFSMYNWFAYLESPILESNPIDNELLCVFCRGARICSESTNLGWRTRKGTFRYGIQGWRSYNIKVMRDTTTLMNLMNFN